MNNDFIGALGLYPVEEIITNTSNDIIYYVSNLTNTTLPTNNLTIGKETIAGKNYAWDESVLEPLNHLSSINQVYDNVLPQELNTILFRYYYLTKNELRELKTKTSVSSYNPILNNGIYYPSYIYYKENIKKWFGYVGWIQSPDETKGGFKMVNNDTSATETAINISLLINFPNEYLFFGYNLDVSRMPIITAWHTDNTRRTFRIIFGAKKLQNDTLQRFITVQYANFNNANNTDANYNDVEINKYYLPTGMTFTETHFWSFNIWREQFFIYCDGALVFTSPTITYDNPNNFTFIIKDLYLEDRNFNLNDGNQNRFQFADLYYFKERYLTENEIINLSKYHLSQMNNPLRIYGTIECDRIICNQIIDYDYTDKQFKKLTYEISQTSNLQNVLDSKEPYINLTPNKVILSDANGRLKASQMNSDVLEGMVNSNKLNPILTWISDIFGQEITDWITAVINDFAGLAALAISSIVGINALMGIPYAINIAQKAIPKKFIDYANSDFVFTNTNSQKYDWGQMRISQTFKDSIDTTLIPNTSNWIRNLRDTKQDTLVAGNNVSIVNNVISTASIWTQTNIQVILPSGYSADIFYNLGNVGIGLTQPNASYKLDVNGNINSSGTFSGNGSALTSLNANNISSGLLSVSRGGTGKGTITASRLLGCITANQVDEIILGTNLSFSGNTLNASGGATSQWTTNTTPSYIYYNDVHVYSDKIRINMPPITFATWVTYKFPNNANFLNDTSGNSRTLVTTGSPVYSLQNSKDTLSLTNGQYGTIPTANWSTFNDLTIAGWFKTSSLINGDRLLDFTNGFTTSTVQKYPPAALASTTDGYDGTTSKTLSGLSYGNGTYLISWSSDYTYLMPPQFFNGDTGGAGGHFAFNTYNANGDCVSGRYIVSGYVGEWVKLTIPSAIYLSYVKIYQRSGLENRAPINYRIYGSNDGTNWTQLLDVVSASYTSLVHQSPTSTSTSSFNRFAIVVNKIGLNPADNNANWTELEFYGYTTRTPNNIVIEKVGTNLSFQINNTQVSYTPSTNVTWSHILWCLKRQDGIGYVRISTTAEGTENTYTITPIPTIASGTYTNKLGYIQNAGTTIYINDFRIITIPLTTAIKYDLFNPLGSYKTLVDDVQLATKQNLLTAGTGITISNDNIISTQWLTNQYGISYYNATNQLNVGIGLNQPTYRLHVNGTLNATTLCENTTLLSEKYAPFTHYHSYLPLSGGNLTGDLGLGTDTKRGKIDIYSGDLVIRASGESGQAKIFLGTPFNTDSSAMKCAIIAEGITNWSRSKLHFCLNDTNDNSSTQTASISDSRMTILPNGNIGIGNNNPYYKFEVNGVSRFSNPMILEGSYYFYFDRTSQYRWRLEAATGDGGNEGNFIFWIYQISTSTWYNCAYIEDDRSWGVQMNFTGQHRCLSYDKDLYTSNYIGYIVSSCGKYKNINSKYGPNNIKQNIEVNDALPIVELSSKENDKKVFGVVSLTQDNDGVYKNGSFVSVLRRDEGDKRIFINGLGEGSIWITNYNGNLFNGDYITTSPIAGLGMKQDSEQLCNYTVAKITMDCDFNPQLIPVEIIKQEEYIVYNTSNITSNIEWYNEITSNIMTSNIEYTINTSYIASSNLLDEYGNPIYEYKLDESSNIVYDYEYEIKDIEYNSNIYKMAFVGCTYKCS